VGSTKWLYTHHLRLLAIRIIKWTNQCNNGETTYMDGLVASVMSQSKNTKVG